MKNIDGKLSFSRKKRGRVGKDCMERLRKVIGMIM